MYQELTRNRDEVTLEEVEQLLLIANQQVQLASNVKAALIAMQEADARLQRIDRPAADPLRKICRGHGSAHGLRRTLIPWESACAWTISPHAVEKLPLAMELRPPEETPSSNDPSPPSESYGSGFDAKPGTDIKQLVRIQSMDKPDVALLSPSQAYFLARKLEVATVVGPACTLARDGTSFKTDIDTASDWIKRYYDTESAPVMRVCLRRCASCEAMRWAWNCPAFPASLDAVRNYRLGARPGEADESGILAAGFVCRGDSRHIGRQYNNGYVLVVAQPYRIELSLNLMAVLLSLAFVIIYLFVRLGAITLRLPAEVREFACAGGVKRRTKRCWMDSRHSWRDVTIRPRKHPPLRWK